MARHWLLLGENNAKGLLQIVEVGYKGPECFFGSRALSGVDLSKTPCRLQKNGGICTSTASLWRRDSGQLGALDICVRDVRRRLLVYPD